MITAIIVEDEMHSREALKNLLNDYCPDVRLLGTATGVVEGSLLLGKTLPDLVFLDIEMDDGTGFDLLKAAGRLSFEVIFTTAHSHYALKAIKFSAIDFLMKPIDIDELVAAIGKVERKQEGNNQVKNLLANLNAADHRDHKITLATSEGLEFIRVSQIVYCEAQGSYTNFFLTNRHSLMVSKNLKEYESLLKGYPFFRIHQSYLINLDQVERYKKADGGSVMMSNGMELGIAQKKKEAFIKLMR